MAITRLWQSGAETGSLSEFDTINGAFAIETLPYTGTYSFKSYNYGWGRVTFSSMSQMRAGFFWKTTVQDQTDVEFFLVQDITLAYVRYANNFRLEVLGGTVGYTPAYPLNTYMHIGIDIKKHGSAGWYYVYINGTLAASFNGNTGATGITAIDIGCPYNKPGTFLFDDIYIDNSVGEGSPNPLPILRFPWVNPNANGNYSQWLGSDLDQTDNYLLVDERPPSGSDYVTASGADVYDSYGMSTYSIGANEQIQAVIPISLAKRDSTTEKLGIGTRYSSTDVIASGVDLSVGAYDFILNRQTTKPGGGNWDQTSIDGFEVVVKSEGTY